MLVSCGRMFPNYLSSKVSGFCRSGQQHAIVRRRRLEGVSAETQVVYRLCTVADSEDS